MLHTTFIIQNKDAKKSKLKEDNFYQSSFTFFLQQSFLKKKLEIEIDYI